MSKRKARPRAEASRLTPEHQEALIQRAMADARASLGPLAGAIYEVAVREKIKAGVAALTFKTELATKMAAIGQGPRPGARNPHKQRVLVAMRLARRDPEMTGPAFADSAVGGLEIIMDDGTSCRLTITETPGGYSIECDDLQGVKHIKPGTLSDWWQEARST